jgi:molecular chaperone HscA
MQALATGRASADAAGIEALSKLLAQATESFAAKRMNRGIAHALAGKNIETI